MGIKQTDARTSIIALVRDDDRERTVNDILNRAGGDIDALRKLLVKLVDDGVFHGAS